MDEPFRHTKDETRTLYQVLKEEGLKRDASWPRYRDAITASVRAARHMAGRPKKDALPYASQAAMRLDGLVKALDRTVRQYQDLGPVLESALNHHLAAATLLDPLLMDSLLATERLVAKRLLLSGRLPLMLKTVQKAAVLAAAPLRNAGKPAAVSRDVLGMLSPDVAKIMSRNTARRRPNGLFQVTGAPKDHAFRYAVRCLWAIYDEATGKPPKMYSTAHVKGGFAGGFYKFAAAALGPARLVDKKVLGSNILTAYKEFRLLLKEDQPKKKVRTPR